jgi:hypothetical protein
MATRFSRSKVLLSMEIDAVASRTPELLNAELGKQRAAAETKTRIAKKEK